MLQTKRSADDAWEQGDRVRTAFVQATNALANLQALILDMPTGAKTQVPIETTKLFNWHTDILARCVPMTVQPVDLPTLPADCWSIVMEFVLERRTTAKFGVEAREWWPITSQEICAQIRSLRLVSRGWCQIVSNLVACIRITPDFINNYTPNVIVERFPNARLVIYNTRNHEKAMHVASEVVKLLEDNGCRRYGPAPSDMSRIQSINTYIPIRIYTRFHGKSETIYTRASARTFVDRLAIADVVITNGFDSAASSLTTPTAVRTKILVLIDYDTHEIQCMLDVLRAIHPTTRAGMHVFLVNCIDGIYDLFHDIGIQCRPNPSDSTETKALINTYIRQIIDILV